MQKCPEKLGIPEGGSAESSTVGTAITRSVDPELAVVVDAWARLPEALRTGILAMIRAAAE